LNCDRLLGQQRVGSHFCVLQNIKEIIFVSYFTFVIIIVVFEFGTDVIPFNKKGTVNLNQFCKFVVGPEMKMNRDRNWFMYVYLCITLI
jgi:hypothetical protein